MQVFEHSWLDQVRRNLDEVENRTTLPVCQARPVAAVRHQAFASDLANDQNWAYLSGHYQRYGNTSLSEALYLRARFL